MDAWALSNTSALDGERLMRLFDKVNDSSSLSSPLMGLARHTIGVELVEASFKENASF